MSGKQKRNPVLLFVSVFAMLAMESPASAYVVNTTSTGMEIKWLVPSVSYLLNTADGPAGNLEAIQAAMQAWSEVPASSFVLTYAGATSSTSHGVNDGQNIVTFAPMGATGTLAQNLYWYNTATGQIIDSDIRFNTTYPWSTVGSSGYYDVQNIASHELGHSLSLSNLYDSADSEKTMYGYSSLGETIKRSLDPDDMAGIAYLYPMSQVPDISVSPASIPFPDVIVLQSSTPREVTISNTGAADLGVTGITLATGTDYSVAPGGSSPCPSLAPTIGAGQNCTVWVTFRPLVVETNISDTLEIASNDADTPHVTVLLSGNGVAAPAPNISVAPTSIAFDNVVVSESSSPQVVTITNTGSARLNVSGTGISLDDATNFLLDLDGGLNGCGTATPSIEAGENCTVSVTFQPQSEASFSASLTVVSDDPDTATVPLSGNGVAAPAPNLSVAPDAIPFPDVIVLYSSTPREVTISNTGAADLGVTGIRLATGTNYSFALAGSNPCLSLAPTIGAGENCTVEVTFRPLVVGTNISDTLEIASDDPPMTATVSLSGNGVAAPAPNISVAPTSIVFYDVVVFDSSSPQVVTITNTGSARLNVSEIFLDDTSNFGLDTNGGSLGCGTATPSIEAGENCTISVTFQPQSEASFSASLTVVSDDPDTATVPLSGNGVAAPAPNLSVAPGAIEFHDVLYGESSTPREVTISNTGTAELAITEIALASETDYSVAEGGSRPCSSLTPAIAAGDNCTIWVTFTPGSVTNSITDTLEITSDDPPMTATVSLSGNGVAVPAPKIVVDPVAIIFGDILVETSSTQAVRISNTGTADLVIEYIRLAGTTASAYSVAPGGSSPCDSMTPTIVAGNYCTVEVTFTPAEVGNDITGTLEIQPADISGTTVSLTGNGSEEIENNPQPQSSGCGCRIVGNNDSLPTRAVSACILMLPLLWIVLAKRFIRNRK